MLTSLSHSKQKFIFLVGVTAIYTAVVLWLDFLQAPPLWDEGHFLETSSTFSDRLIPSIDDLKDYGELSTPLPFIIFGAMEHLFQQGIFAGRLLNLLLSVGIVTLIGWPSREKKERALKCLIGLLLCPYFIWYSALMYTDVIACFLGLMGVMAYVRDRHWLSSLAFILAIASRQYLIAFPAAIVTYEFLLAMKRVAHNRRFRLSEQWRWLAPLLAALTLLFWFYLFQGLAPATAIDGGSTPDVQKTTWALMPGGVINFLAFVGFYLIIPEFIVFWPSQPIKQSLHIWQKQRRKIVLIALGLLLYQLAFSPVLLGLGSVLKIANLLPFEFLKLGLFYLLALIACLRFSRPNLLSLFVLFNSLIMLKAYPWDKYILPLAVIFWYLKSVDLEEKGYQLSASVKSKRLG